MNYGQRGEENTVIYSIILFPPQSPFIDFNKDKGAGSALQMDEKLSKAEIDILSILVDPFAFHNFLCNMIEKELISINRSVTPPQFPLSSRYNLFQMFLLLVSCGSFIIFAAFILQLKR